jgi:hypothetical protein
VALGGGGVERDRLDRGRAQIVELLHRRVEVLGRAGGEHDGSGPPSDELAARRQGDVGTAAEHENGLDGTERVLHGVQVTSGRGGG